MPYSAAVHQAVAKAEGGQIELPADSCKVGTALGHHLVNNMNNIKVKCSVHTLYKGKEHCHLVDIIHVDISFFSAESASTYMYIYLTTSNDAHVFLLC